MNQGKTHPLLCLSQVQLPAVEVLVDAGKDTTCATAGEITTQPELPAALSSAGNAVGRVAREVPGSEWETDIV